MSAESDDPRPLAGDDRIDDSHGEYAQGGHSRRSGYGRVNARAAVVAAAAMGGGGGP